MRLDEEKLREDLDKEFSPEEMQAAEPKPPRKKRRKKPQPAVVEFTPQETPPNESPASAAADTSQAQPSQTIIYITPEAAAAFYNVFGKILSIGAQRFKNVPAEIADRAMAFSEVEKAMLGPQTAKVINKHAPQFLIKYADEIMLVMMLSGVIMGKFKACDEIMSQMKPAPVVSISKEEKTEAEKSVIQ